MLRVLARAALLAAAFAFVAPVASAQPVEPPRSSSGDIGGSPYRIEFPAQWNGSLVIAAHGYVPAGTRLPDWWPRYEFAPILLERGYAVASVGYSRQGWALAEAVPEAEAVRRLFVERYGKPKRSFMVGTSMGGLVTVASQEATPGAYDGGLSLCGAVAPAAEGARDRV